MSIIPLNPNQLAHRSRDTDIDTPIPPCPRRTAPGCSRLDYGTGVGYDNGAGGYFVGRFQCPCAGHPNIPPKSTIDPSHFQAPRADLVQKPFTLNRVSLLHFVIFSFLSCPPNILWQEFLEDKFPGYFTDSTGQSRLDKLNTARKFTLDQTLGAYVNTVLFIAAMSAFKGKDFRGIYRDLQRVSGIYFQVELASLTSDRMFGCS